MTHQDQASPFRPDLLTGKVALITGAGRTDGMGQATARALAAAGAHVVITDLARDRPELRHSDTVGLGDDLGAMERFAAQLRDDFGTDALAMSLDITDPAEAADVLQSVVAELGSLDILFNNAAATTGVGHFMDQTDDQWNLSWQVNVMGTRRMSMLAIRQMQAHGGGVIVNNISTGGIVSDAGFGAYNATKFGVSAITKLIAKEYGADGIRCVGICPGLVQTGMTAANMELVADLEAVDVDEARDLTLSLIPLGRAASPNEVGQLVTFLASPAAAYITGALIPIDGGMLP